jgi:hypothetical protein
MRNMETNRGGMLAATIALATQEANGKMTVAALRKARKVAQFIAEWELVVRDQGGAITVEEFGKWWRESPATVYRRLSQFRELYPDAQHPHDLMGPLLRDLRIERYGKDPVVLRDAAVIGVTVEALLDTHGYDPTIARDEALAAMK